MFIVRLLPFGRCITAMANLPRYHSPSAKIKALGDIHNICIILPYPFHPSIQPLHTKLWLLRLVCECAEEVWSQYHTKRLVV
jgi:hypothetical protein